MASQSDVAAAIIAALSTSEPDLDTTVGSVTRKIIDAVAGQISAASVDTHLLTYQYDIDSKTGADLDAFVQLFGLARFPAARAIGTVTFTRGTSADVISVPINTQVSTMDGTVVVQTLAAAILDIGALSASVPVQAVNAGPDGDVAAGALSQLQTPLSEINATTNVNPLTGGTNQETDDQLRQRWKDTVFRNMAGTQQMFLGVALNNPACQAANVVGAATRRREQVQIVGGAASSTVSDAAFIYPTQQVVGRDIDNGDIALPGLQYNWLSASIPPQIQVLDASYFPNGQLVDLSFLYLDDSSRNVPEDGVLNRVDIWCAGSDPVSAAQSVIFRASLTFSASSTDNFYSGAFVRPDGTSPTAGNVFIPLAFGPIVTLPSTITINGVTYGLATPAHPMGTVSGGVTYAYQIVHRNGAFGWAAISDFGIEWLVSAQPPSNSVFSLSAGYTYNQIPAVVQASIDTWKLAGSDVLTHQAKTLFLRFSLAIIYDPSISQSVTQTAISNALQAYLSSLGFNSRVYPSSVIQVVENTPGVLASRFIVGSDVPGFNPVSPNLSSVGIQQVLSGAVIHSFVDSGGNPVDVEIGDDTVPSFGGTVLVAKAGNSFGSFA